MLGNGQLLVQKQQQQKGNISIANFLHVNQNIC